MATRVIESVQTVLTALALAFIFRAFFVEAFIIPTGSMAESLLGQHGTLLCPTCGWEFDYGPGVGRIDERGDFSPPTQVYCPNCHTYIPLPQGHGAFRAGDRILVHKWPYVLGGLLAPKRWDVIVFRDPANTAQNYIKRLVALPNETVEIIDGDVFIQSPGQSEFHVARKTPAAQESLWFVVFDQNYLPTDPARAHRSPAWIPEKPAGQPDVGWTGMETRVIRYAAHDDAPRALVFEPTGSRHYLQDVYGYDHGAATSYVGDVRIVAEVTFENGRGSLRWELTRDGRLFAVQFGHDGRVVLSTRAAGSDSEPVVFATTTTAPLVDGRPHVIEFGHLDYHVYARLDGREIVATTPDQYAPRLDELRTSRRIAPVGIRMLAAGLSLSLRDLRVDRDVYYLRTPNTQRAYPEHPFALGDDEYFVLGDNSPDSVDSREWYRVGPHLEDALRDGTYRLGTVRADQIVGQAFFVYLPGLLPLDGDGRLRIPDVGRMRFIR